MDIRVLICGANGYMGKCVASLIRSEEGMSVVAGYDLIKYQYPDFPVYDSLDELTEAVDVIIDFSHPSAFRDITGYAVSSALPIVIATTGLSETQQCQISESALSVPVFYSANMSIGINLLIGLVKKLTPKAFQSFDIEIIEKHHRRKVDAPSGTALKIADAINASLPRIYTYTFDRKSESRSRRDDEIGFSSVRGGTIAGEHTVIFAGHDEIIELKHTALSREIFAVGAINAARFIVGKNPGLYDMDDLIGG